MRALLLFLLTLPAFAGAQKLPDSGHPVRATGDYLSRMDADHDRRVSLPEYQDWLSYAFDAMDRNRDTVLTADELPGNRGRAITRSEHRDRLASTFRKQDGNRDGYLTAKELAAPPR
jgi:Ca2+-binding EF-hand superfamily protein